MRLWTWQCPDWDITAQPRDASRMQKAWGEHSGPSLAPLYDRLHEELGTDQFLFCFTRYEHWLEGVRRLWVLDVPTHSILRYKDSPSWEALLKLSRCDGSAVPSAPEWDTLFVDESSALSRIDSGERNVIPLVAVPISRDCVTCNKKFNKGRRYPDAPYKELPDSEEAARRCQSAPI